MMTPYASEMSLKPPPSLYTADIKFLMKKYAYDCLFFRYPWWERLQSNKFQGPKQRSTHSTIKGFKYFLWTCFPGGSFFVNVDLSACTPIRRCISQFRAAWVTFGVSLFVFGVVYLTVTNTNTTPITLKQSAISRQRDFL